MKWVRPAIITILALAMVGGFFMGKIPSEVFIGFATGLVVWWFKSRDQAKEQP